MTQIKTDLVLFFTQKIIAVFDSSIEVVSCDGYYLQ